MTSILGAILLGGAVAGALDISYACMHWGLAHGVPPMRIFQSVGAGLLGREEATSGGWRTAGIGLGMHFLLTTIMAAFFVLWTRMVPDLNRWPLLSGVTYGLGLFRAGAERPAALCRYVHVYVDAAGRRPTPLPETLRRALEGLAAEPA